MMTVLVILAALLVLVAAYFGVVVFSPWVREQHQPIPAGAATGPATGSENESRRAVRFKVAGVEVAGWLYLPRDVKGPVPCVVLNNGLGGTRDVVVGPYARRFAEAGMAALTYDYRHFGDSGGEPRQLYLSDLQVEDCRGAVAYARSLPEVDGKRIGIWGTSACGWYGLLVAADDRGITCVCAQCASLDHGADGKLIFKREGIGYFLRLFVHAARDKGRARFGLSPHHIGIVGRPHTAALLTAPGVLEDCAPVFGARFRNEMCARVMVTPHGKTAADVIEQVSCPALIQICEQDPLVSLEGSLGMAARLGGPAEVKRYPIGHFDIYQGEHFERSVADQIEFFSRHLRC
jgi:uncharacterized protein